MIYGISRNNSEPYVLADEYDRIRRLYQMNVVIEPDADWQIVAHCEGCGCWFPEVEEYDGYHSPECKEHADGSALADSLEDR